MDTKHIATICMMFGLFSAAFVLFSWGVVYYCNALFDMHFETASCWQGISAIRAGMVGFDVSDNNGFVNWQEIAEVGIEFAMIACSYGKSGRHDRFLENVNGAHTAGLKVGAYHYSYALTPEDVLEEAWNCQSAIEEAGVLLELPVFFDMEDADHWKERHGFDFSNENITGICKVFLDNIGLDCGIYASLSWLENLIDWKSLNCAVWNAEWINPGEDPDEFPNGDSIKGYMWQYTDKLIIGDKEFDGDVLY